jgi:hypothetical protein
MRASNPANEVQQIHLSAPKMNTKPGLGAVHTERVTIALPPRLKRQVYDAAECKGIPASEFIRDAIAMAAASPRAA